MQNLINVYTGEFELIARNELSKIGKEAQKEVKKRTPELTGLLEDEINLSEITKDGNNLSIEVFTDLEIVPYAEIVEDGVKGKKYQYHKPNGTPFGPKRVGAKMYEDTAKIYQQQYAKIS